MKARTASKPSMSSRSAALSLAIASTSSTAATSGRGPRALPPDEEAAPLDALSRAIEQLQQQFSSVKSTREALLALENEVRSRPSSAASATASSSSATRERPEWARMLQGAATAAGPSGASDRGVSGRNGSTRSSSLGGGAPSSAAGVGLQIPLPRRARAADGASSEDEGRGTAGRPSGLAITPEVELFDVAPRPLALSPPSSAASSSRRAARLVETPGPSVDIPPSRAPSEGSEAARPTAATYAVGPPAAPGREALAAFLRSGSQRAALRPWGAEPPPASPPSPHRSAGRSPPRGTTAFDPESEAAAYRANVRAALAALRRGRLGDYEGREEDTATGAAEDGAAFRWETRAVPGGGSPELRSLRAALEQPATRARSPSPTVRVRVRGSPVRASSLDRAASAEWRREETGRGLALGARQGKRAARGRGGLVSHDLGAAEAWNCLRTLADGLARPWQPLREQSRGAWVERVEGARASVSERRLAELERYFVGRARESFGTAAYPRGHRLL